MTVRGLLVNCTYADYVGIYSSTRGMEPIGPLYSSPRHCLIDCGNLGILDAEVESFDVCVCQPDENNPSVYGAELGIVIK